MSVPLIYRKQLGMLRQPFDENTRGVYVPVIQWCADHKDVLDGEHSDALLVIEATIQALSAAVHSCEERLKDLFPESTDES